MMAARAYIALGANLGDRGGNIQSALSAIEASAGLQLLRVSTFFENPAIGSPAGSPDFLNAAAEVETELPPARLLDRLLEIEQSLGRRRTQKNAPRPIDLDLLLYEDRIEHSGQLTLPHPRMHERLFVLKPLAEIAPTVIHPVLGLTILQLLQRLTDARSPLHR